MRFSLRRFNYRHILPDAALIVFSLYASLYLRLDAETLPQYLPILNRYILLFLIVRLATFAAMGMYDIIWRYVSVSDAIKVFKAVLMSSVILIAMTYLVDVRRIPRSTFFIDSMLITLLLACIRLGRRVVFEHSSRRLLSKNGKLALIYGAGTNGRTLATRLETDSNLGMKLVGFMDDDRQKIGRFIGGIKVLGARKDLPEVLRNYLIQELIISTPSIPGPELREILQIARGFQIRPRMISQLSQNRDRKSADFFRSIELSDLLSRPQRAINAQAVRELMKGKRVMITGAGGSIGSELARQILECHPSRLLLVDHSEFSLYEIDRELRVSPSDTSLIVPLLADVKDQLLIRRIMQEHNPEIIFHAAAYKHVHLVEANPYSAILNNVLGTRNIMDLAQEMGVGTFVLISTDKAVNPAGIMGATKYVCELMVTGAGTALGRKYCAVRFGNVLGSSGSLIPLLQKQIRNGEPVTITHPDITRYFMLIPEAISLVLQAATISRPGDVNILRMGEPIRVLEIAKSLIALMGKSEAEVPVVFTGLRPGEKMHEELYLQGDELNTEHPDILVLPGRGRSAAKGSSDLASIHASVDRMIAAAREGSRDAILALKALSQGNCYTTGDGESAAANVVALDPAFR